MDASPTIHGGRLAAQLDGAPFALAAVTATKPDFYRQAPVVAAANRTVHGDDDLRATMRSGPALFGEDVGEAVVGFLDGHRGEPFELSHERAGFDDEADADLESP